MKRYYDLKFSPPIEVAIKKESVNPKRLQREVRKHITQSGIGTKSQQALKLQREENRLERKIISRAEREAKKQRQFELKKLKRKKKHRGR